MEIENKCSTVTREVDRFVFNQDMVSKLKQFLTLISLVEFRHNLEIGWLYEVWYKNLE